jgi:hypothetical protein
MARPGARRIRDDLKGAIEDGRSIERLLNFLCRSGTVCVLSARPKNCETKIETEAMELGAGAGRMQCLECGGDGSWGKFERAGLD